MTNFFIILTLALGFLITFQIAKASEYVAVLRGLEKSGKTTNKINAFLLLLFLIFGLIGVYVCNLRLEGKILKFGTSASDHGILVDNMMKYTLIITGIVFVITQVLLFWYSFRYQESENRKVFYFPHNNKLEVIWTVIPAIVLSVMVAYGMVYWYRITDAAPKDAMVVEVTGSQFKWEFRYPGRDKVLGKKYYRNISELENNPLGQIWDDAANKDDIYASSELHLVVNKPIQMVIGAKDVIHDVGLPHFRLKMDAVPGTPTTMWFTPIKTTKQMREETGDPKFVFELSCDQMCGKGHYSMRAVIVVETQEEFDAYMAGEKSQYSRMMAAKKAAAPDSTVIKPVAGTKK